MKVRGKVTPKMRERVLALAAEGLSQRQVEAQLSREGIALSHASVGAICREAGVGRSKLHRGPRANDVPKLARRAAAAPELDDTEPPSDPEDRLEADAALVDAALDRPPLEMPPLADDAGPAVVAVWERLRSIREEVASLKPKVRSGDYPPTQWATLVRLELACAKDLAALTPPPPPDPAKDPHSIAARAMLVQHVTRVIQAVELRHGRLCPRCSSEVA